MRVAQAVAAALAAAVWATWPLAAQLGDHVYDSPAAALRADIYLTHWITAWVARALTTHPTALFHANVFHPAAWSLAASEHMLGAMPLYLPLSLLGDPVVAHQATLLLTFACAALATAALVWDWTGSWPAAALAGALFAFSPYRAANLASLHLQGNYYLPLVVLAARRATAGPGLRWPAVLTIALALQGLHSYYLGYAAFLTTALLAATVLVLDPTARRRAAALVVPICVAAAVVSAVSIPYALARRAGGIPPPSTLLLAVSSGAPNDTGASGVALALAVSAALLGRRGLRAGVGGAWLVGVALAGLGTFLVACGPTTVFFGQVVPGPYRVLARVVPGFDAIRVPSRFHAASSMAVAVLAGVATAGVLGALGRVRPALGRAAGAVAVAGALATAARFQPGGLPLRPIETWDTLPPVYRWLATAPAGAVLELPFADYRVSPVFEVEALRMYRSIYHWHPIVNGYSGYPPPTYALLAGLAARLPEPTALRDLVRLAGVRWIVLQPNPLRADVTRAWEASGLPRLTFGQHVVYELPDVPAGEPPLAHADVRDRTSPTGLALAPLAPAAQGATITVEPLRPLPYALVHQITVTVENRGDRPWPGLALPGTGGVGLTFRVRGWESDFPTTPLVTPLGVDVGPGESARVPLRLSVPPRPGRYDLDVWLVQDGVGPFDPALGGAVTLPVEAVAPPSLRTR